MRSSGEIPGDEAAAIEHLDRADALGYLAADMLDAMGLPDPRVSLGWPVGMHRIARMPRVDELAKGRPMPKVLRSV